MTIFEPSDYQQNRLAASFGYVIFFIPLLVCPHSRLGRYAANQGLLGFLAMLAGMMNIDESVYEAGEIDGLRNRFQEVFYITIPMMKPQMLFGLVMAVVNTFQVGHIGVSLSGANPTPQYAGQLIVNLIEDYGFIRYEMGYASAASVVLLVLIYAITRWSGRIFKKD